MKKYLISLILLLSVILVFTACGNNSGAPATSGTPAGGTPAASEPGGTQPTYKETMVPYDQVTKAERIVILQNTLNYSRSGFYTADTKPVTEKIQYKGSSVDAYPLSYTLAFLHNQPKGDLTVTSTTGSTKKISADDFAGLYAIIDFKSDKPPVLYNPKNGTAITDFLYAKTAEGEAIFSVVSGSTYKADEIITKAGFDPKATYNFVATDKFYIPVKPEESAVGEVRGSLSGAINASFPGMTIASGKINDVIFIEAIK